MSATDLLAALWALMLYNLPVVAHVALAISVCFILGCRVAKMMRGVTALSVFLQHATLAVGMFGSVLLSFSGHTEWAAASGSAGALVFLLMSMRRWRFSPPAGTNRAHPVPPHQLRHVTGGTRSEP